MNERKQFQVAGRVWRKWEFGHKNNSYVAASQTL